MFQLALQYDNSQLEFLSQTAGPAFTAQTILRNGDPRQIEGDIWEVQVTYTGDLLDLQTVYGDLTLCTFEFAIREETKTGATPLTLRPENSYILDAESNNVFAKLKNGEIIIEPGAPLSNYNYHAYLQPEKTLLQAGDTLYADVMLEGDLNYTQLMAEITFDADFLEYAGYEDLQGWVAACGLSSAGNILLRSVPSSNMVTGAPCPGRVVRLKFTVKEGWVGESVDTSLGFAALTVSPPAGAIGATTAPAETLSIRLEQQ
jgi:hypothetical protein